MPSPAAEKVNLARKFAAIDDLWSPGIVAEINDYKVQIVKVKGEFVWHSHATPMTSSSSTRATS